METTPAPPLSPVVEDGVVFGDRTKLEIEYFEALHAEVYPETTPYLGAVVDGKWEIRAALARAALAHVLGTLVASGHVVEIAGEPLPTFLAANLYEKSIPPAVERKSRPVQRPAFLVDRPKSDYELQRERQIAKNEAFLNNLGLK